MRVRKRTSERTQWVNLALILILLPNHTYLSSISILFLLNSSPHLSLLSKSPSSIFPLNLSLFVTQVITFVILYPPLHLPFSCVHVDPSASGSCLVFETSVSPAITYFSFKPFSFICLKTCIFSSRPFILHHTLCNLLFKFYRVKNI